MKEEVFEQVVAPDRDGFGADVLELSGTALGGFEDFGAGVLKLRGGSEVADFRESIGCEFGGLLSEVGGGASLQGHCCGELAA